MFTVSSSEQDSIDDALYETLNALDLSKSKEFEFTNTAFLDDGEPESICSTLKLTSGVLGREVSKRIRDELSLSEDTALRIEIEPAMMIYNIEEGEDEQYRLIDTDNINYTIFGQSENICVLSNNKGKFDSNGKWNDGDSHYDCDNWNRHTLTAPSVYNSMVHYLNSALGDSTSLPMADALLDYYN